MSASFRASSFRALVLSSSSSSFPVFQTFRQARNISLEAGLRCLGWGVDQSEFGMVRGRLRRTGSSISRWCATSPAIGYRRYRTGYRRRGAGVGLNRLLPVRRAQQLRRKIHQPSIAIPQSTQNPAESVIVPGIPCRDPTAMPARPPAAGAGGTVTTGAGRKPSIETLRHVRPSSKV